MAYKITIAGCQEVAFTTSGSTASGSVLGAKAVVLYASADCFVNVGTTAGGTGSANLFVPANTFLELNTIGLEQSTMTARGKSEAGTLYINPIASV
jgi:hypothetical protein